MNFLEFITGKFRKFLLAENYLPYMPDSFGRILEKQLMPRIFYYNEVLIVKSKLLCGRSRRNKVIAAVDKIIIKV